MTKAMTRDSQIAAIDEMIREITWCGQKHLTQTLIHPEIKLTFPQMITLLAIHDSGTCRMGTLAEITQQSGGTLTGIVDRLIEDGLVERVRSLGDRRVVEVALTAAGRTRIRAVIEARQQYMAQVVDHFSDAELTQFEELLSMFHQGIRAAMSQDSQSRPVW